MVLPIDYLGSLFLQSPLQILHFFTLLPIVDGLVDGMLEVIRLVMGSRAFQLLLMPSWIMIVGHIDLLKSLTKKL